MTKRFLIITVLIAGLLAAPLHAAAVKEITVEARDAIAVERLNENSNEAAVFVRGMICSSCGIGVQKHLRKIEGLDKSRHIKGIELNAKTQLAFIALKEGAAPGRDAIATAIYDAGYDPVTLYYWDGEKVTQVSLLKEKPEA